MRKTLKTLWHQIPMAILAATLTVSMIAPGTALAEAKAGADISYSTTLFDQSYVHQIDVQIAKEDWEDLLAHPTQKTKYHVTVTVDGERYEDVSFAAKGNTSLSAVAMSDSTRYSFKLNFGKFATDQTYHGLKKLNLSNIYADATYMKDYVSYEIFKTAGVDAPLTSYVQLSINGETHGLYLAIEDISKSYLNRTQEGKGELYKPDSGFDNINEGPGGDFEMPEGFDFSEDFTLPEGFELPEGFSLPEEGTSPAGSAEDNSEDETDHSFGDFPGNDTADDEPANAQGGGLVRPGADPLENPKPENESSLTISENDSVNDPAPADENDNASNVPQPEQSDRLNDTTPAEQNDQNDAQGGGSPNGQSGGEEGSSPDRPNGDFDGDSPGSSAGSNRGADLAYSDDNPEHYSGIFDNAETTINEEDQQKVIAALKNLSEGNITQALDADEVIRYFAAHNFVMNYDSYTGGMLHNYYLYERGGRLSMLPWDYNLAFGTFGNMDFDHSGATGTINYGIDSPLSGSTEESRPMWSWIVNTQAYLQQYHQVYEELIGGYFESGEFETEMNRVYEMIRPYVETDPTAFFTVEEFDTAYENLLAFCLLRAESIRKQLNGELAPITSEQNPEDRVDASSVSIAATGGMTMGFGPNGESDGDSDGDSNGESNGAFFR